MNVRPIEENSTIAPPLHQRRGTILRSAPGSCAHAAAALFIGITPALAPFQDARATNPPAAAPPKTPAASAPTTPAPFAQEVPGVAFRFEMLPIPASSDGAIKPFYMAKTEFTWEAFDVYVYRLDQPGGTDGAGGAGGGAAPDAVTRPSKPYLPPDRGFGHEGFAAISMSFKNATEFCKWLSTKTGRTYRLPTEDEWEHACRAGEKGDFPCDACSTDPSKLGEYAWFAVNADAKPHAVGKLKPNVWGLHDMHGNVAEWVTGRDGKPVLKGGSYQDPPEKLAISARQPNDRAWNASDPQVPKSQWWLANGPFVGFRVVCDEAPAPAAK